MASEMVAVPSSIICWAVKYLILEAQQPDGMFKEEGYVYDYAMRVRVLLFINKNKILTEMKMGNCH